MGASSYDDRRLFHSIRTPDGRPAAAAAAAAVVVVVSAPPEASSASASADEISRSISMERNPDLGMRMFPLCPTPPPPPASLANAFPKYPATLPPPSKV